MLGKKIHQGHLRGLDLIVNVQFIQPKNFLSYANTKPTKFVLVSKVVNLYAQCLTTLFVIVFVH